jgi:hypothetical protein
MAVLHGVAGGWGLDARSNVCGVCGGAFPFALTTANTGPYGVSARSEPEPFRLGGCDTALGPSFGLASHAAVDAHLRFFLPDGWLV